MTTTNEARNETTTPLPSAEELRLREDLARLSAADPHGQDHDLAEWAAQITKRLRCYNSLHARERAIELQRAAKAMEKPRRALLTCFASADDDVMVIRLCEARRAIVPMTDPAGAPFELYIPGPIAFVSADEWPALAIALDAMHAELDRRTDLQPQAKRIAIAITGDERWDPRAVMTAAGVDIAGNNGVIACGWWLEDIADLRVLARWAATAEIGIQGLASMLPRGERPAGVAPLAEKIWERARWIVNHRNVAGTIDGAMAFWKDWERQHPEPTTHAATTTATVTAEPRTRRRLSLSQAREMRDLVTEAMPELAPAPKEIAS